MQPKHEKVNKRDIVVETAMTEEPIFRIGCKPMGSNSRDEMDKDATAIHSRSLNSNSNCLAFLDDLTDILKPARDIKTSNVGRNQSASSFSHNELAESFERFALSTNVLVMT